MEKRGLKCAKLSLEECNKYKECKFVNGKTRKYCRKTDKTVNKRKPPTTQKKNVREKPNEKPVNETKNVYKKTPRGHMNENSITMRRNFLMSICPDSGECLAIGREMKTIRDYFNGFVDFQYLQPKLDRIGQAGNGFIKGLKYTRDGYSSYAVLKSANKQSSDSLVYEYLVGQYINKLCNYFPCFLETYGLYHYKDDASWKQSQLIKTTGDSLRNSLIRETAINYKRACKNNKHSAILIQHMNNAKTLNTYINSRFIDTQFVDSDMPFVLFQIYYTLSELCDTFTHYDLHSENVLLYKLESSKCIKYHYQMPSGKVHSFKSEYVVKIIDYGRNFFSDPNSNNNSKIIRSELCMTTECNPDCGKKVGFAWLRNSNTSSKDHYYIDSAVPNRSHDLRLLNGIRGACKNMKNCQYFNNFFQNLVYDRMHYGTPELPDDYEIGGKIQTVNDARMGLSDLISNRDVISKNNDKYDASKYTKIGDLYIYGKNRPMEYVPE
jgi:hypothetical protein